MSEHGNETLAKNIRDLARALLDDPQAGSIIRGMVPNENLPEADLDILLDLADEQPFMERYKDSPTYDGHPFNRSGFRYGELKHQARVHNPHIAIAVARGVAAGHYYSVDDEQATKLITTNMVPWDEYLEKTCREENWRPRWHHRKLTFDEYYEVLAEVWPDPKFQKALTKAIKAFHKVHGDFLDRYTWKPAREALEDVPYMAMLRRGWVSNPRFWSAAMYIKGQNLDMDDKAQIRSFFQGNTRLSFDGQIMPDGPSLAEVHNIDFRGEQ